MAEYFDLPIEQEHNIFMKDGAEYCDFHLVLRKNANKIPSTGLGLAIVHEYVEINKGEITIKSELDKGTEVTLTFSY